MAEVHIGWTMSWPELAPMCMPVCKLTKMDIPNHLVFWEDKILSTWYKWLHVQFESRHQGRSSQATNLLLPYSPALLQHQAP